MPPEPSSKTKTGLALASNDLNFGECTSLLGVSPTKTFVRKFGYDSTLIPLREWSRTISVDDADTIGDVVNTLLDGFPISPHEIGLLAEKHDWKVTVASTVTLLGEDRPSYSLSSDTIKRLAALNAELIVGIYDYT